MSTFILIWQDPESRRWHPVARLIRGENAYMFLYTKGASASERFLPFGNMTELNAAYVSRDLFPIFANRVMSERRPEFERYASWSGMADAYSADPLLLMATMGGSRATDTLQVYPVPEMTPDGMYYTVFFAHGISHLPDASQHRVYAALGGDRLYPMLDIQNPFDERAVALRTDDPTSLVGYLPRHLAGDLSKLVAEPENNVRIKVKQINFDAPPQYRLLCEVSSVWPAGFSPCSEGEYLPLVPVDPSELFERLPADFQTRNTRRRHLYQ